MKNYLLYFFILLLWTSLIPFTPAIIGNESAEESTPEVKLKVKTSGGETKELTLEEYVLGVMLTEMPANYEKQALLAQAVVIRSYTEYLLENRQAGNPSNHPDFALCSDAACCRNYITYEELVTLAGETNAAARYAAMSAAVNETAGEVLTYNGKTAMTLYHVSSCAHTESYQNVFGVAVPYLVGTDNVDEASFIYYKKNKHFTFAELQTLLASGGYSYTYTEGEQTIVDKNENLRCTSILLGNTEIKATDFVKLTGLNSFCIEIVKDTTGYTFSSFGYGSGLGMSQYGANILASQGKTYQDILKFYFKDTTLEKRK